MAARKNHKDDVYGTESDRLTQLRARLTGDPSFDASQVDVAFEDGALHLSGVMHDEKAWFALVSVAGSFATTVVDEIHVKKIPTP